MTAYFEQGPKSLVADPVDNSLKDEESSFVMASEDLSDLEKLVQEAVQSKDISALNAYLNRFESNVASVEPEVADNLIHTLNEFISEEDAGRGHFPAAPGIKQVYDVYKRLVLKFNGNISDEEYKIVQDLILRLNNLRKLLEDRKDITTLPVAEQLISPVATNGAEPEGDSRSWSDHVDTETEKTMQEAFGEDSQQVEENVLATEEQNRVDSNVTVPEDRGDSGCGSGGSTPEIPEAVPVPDDTHTPEARDAKQIINEYNEKGFTPLHVAAQNGDINEGDRLIKLGANIEITTLKSNQTNNYGNTALHLAAQEGHKDFVELLLKCGANVNSISNTESRDTPLHEAAYNGHVDVVNLLIEHRAKIDAGDRHNHTPLMFASANGKPKVVKLLLQKGADLYLQDNNDETALHRVADNGYPNVVSVLINKAKDKKEYVNTQGVIGTALHVIAHKSKINEEHKKVIKLLLDNGTCPYLKNNPTKPLPGKEDSLTMARRRENTKFIEFMTSLDYSIPPQVTPTEVPAQISGNNAPGAAEPGQSTQKSNFPTKTILTLTAIGIGMETVALGMCFALDTSLLATEIVAAIGICCLVAAVTTAIVYYYEYKSSIKSDNVTKVAANGPLSSVESDNVTHVADTKAPAVS